MNKFAFAALAAILASGPCNDASAIEKSNAIGHREVTRERILGQTEIPIYDYRIVKTYPHDTTSYTEGLVMYDGKLYEGTGRYGFSKLMEIDIETGRAVMEVDVDPLLFGEGVTVIGDDIYQLTYIGNTGYRYDRTTFERQETVRFITQGWGMTTNGTDLIRSDGSSSIVFHDPATMAPLRHIFVSDDVGPVGFLNELELVGDTLYANVWQTDFIAMIDPDTGKITGWIDMTGLNPDPKTLVYPYVLNGIAYDEASGHLLVTGKCWPHLWEIELVERTR